MTYCFCHFFIFDVNNKIVAENILKTRNKLNEILAANTGKSVEEIARDTERDNYMSAQEALAYGLIDSVVDKRN